jgi:hypothetical protein
MACQWLRCHKRPCPSSDRLPNFRPSSQIPELLRQVLVACHRCQLGRQPTYICSNRQRYCALGLLDTKSNNRNLIAGVPTVPVLGYVFWRFPGGQERRDR